VALEDGGDAVRQPGVEELLARDVDRDHEVVPGVILASPRRQLAARLVENERVDLSDQAALLGERNELGRKHDPPLGMAPAHEGLGAAQ
jgi:hypothetical protein